MTTLKDICTQVLEAAEKATPRPWEYYDDSEQEHTSYPISMLADGHSPCGIFPTSETEVYVPLDAQPCNGAFIVTAANNAGKLAQAVLILEEALEKYAEGNALQVKPEKRYLYVESFKLGSFEFLQRSMSDYDDKLTAREALERARSIGNKNGY